MNRMQMAHEHMMAMISAGCHDGMELLLRAWEYADAMKAEADKRNKAEAEQKRKEVREILSDANTFIEREGQHFDDVEEWQPDWSQAPEWAKTWTLNRHGEGVFWSEIPVADHNGYFLKHENYKLKQGLCYLFGYTGNWQDSLRKRPQ